MKAHIIENGIVVNTIVVDDLTFMPNLVDGSVGGVGWSYADGVFTAPVIVVSDEEKAQQVRSRRDSLLTESDWTQVADAPVDKTAWATYRQLLRDVTLQDEFPTTIAWPTKPE